MNVNLFGCLSEIFLEHDHVFKLDFIIFTTIETSSLLSLFLLRIPPRSSTIKICGNFICNFPWSNQIVGFNGTCREKVFQPQMFFFFFFLRFFEIFFLCWDFKEILNFIVIVLLQLLLQVFSLFFHYIDFYQTAHFFSGFIFEPKGQLKSLENSSMFERGPSTRNLPGLWKPVVIRSFIASGLYLLHQVFAALIQNNCWGL